MASTNDENGNRKRKAPTVTCPYLDTVQRSVLDFDFLPECSVSLQTGPHIYACLVCSKYFRGRGRQTPAFTHAVEESHFVFVHLASGKFYCLPDGYEIRDTSLQDIRDALHPTFSPEKIKTLDSNTELSRDLFGRRYLPGFVGLNNLNKTDGINAIIQALAHVPPLRDYFLRQSSTANGVQSSSSHKHQHAYHVTACFGALVRKMWSDRRFKSHVDPHPLIQAVAKRFPVGQQPEAGECMAWFLHQLHLGTGGGRKPGSSIIHKLFQGKVRVTTRQAKLVEETHQAEDDDRLGSDDEGEAGSANRRTNDQDDEKAPKVEETVDNTHFLQLTLDIPEKPLFRDDDGGLVIPQEPLSSVLQKFDGMTFFDALSRSGAAQQKKYQLVQLPDYLVLHLARFKKNDYSREKNPTIVIFPVKNLDLSDYVEQTKEKEEPPTAEQVRSMSIKELKELFSKYGQKDILQGVVEKDDLVDTAVDLVSKLPDLLSDKYDLVSNITHERPADVGREGKSDPLQEGSYKCHVRHRETNQWYELQDLHVQEMMAQQIGLSESYVLIFERKSRSIKLR